MSTIESNLQLFQNLISCGRELYFWTFDASLSIAYTSCPLGEELVSFLRPKGLSAELFSGEPVRPVVLTNDLGLVWIAVAEKDSLGDIQAIHAIGPVYMEDVSPSSVEQFLRRRHIYVGNRDELRALFRNLPVVPITHFHDYGLMLHYCVTGEKIGFSDFVYVSAASSVKQESEAELPVDSHGTWAMEQELLRFVEEGNLNYKELSAKISSSGRQGQLGNGDPLRHMKNLAIVFTALCTRAAIRGGLGPEIAYTLSDRYISGAEACHTISDVAEIIYAMQDDFVHRVHQSKIASGLSPQVKLCQNYLQLHLSEKISIKELAARMGYSEPYLARTFKKETGMTMNEYQMSLKVGAAKDLLRGGKKSVQEICTELGFCSQSYFGMKFKEYTGVTPSEYRNL